jgi:proline dehydrogenase
LAERAIAERLLYRIVKRHIAGTTMSSAIDKAKELNGKKLPVSISFLSDRTTDSTKARYATTTYLELIRRIARMGLKASIQVPLDQIGFDISDDVAAKNANDIINTGKTFGVFVWFEIHDHRITLPAFLQEAKGVGYAVSVDNSDEYLWANRGIRAVKILCTNTHVKKKDEAMRVRNAVRIVKNTVVQSASENALKELLNGSRVKKSLIFEMELGYNSKKLSNIARRGGRVSVYVPFGKDWEHYAMSRTPERYARFIATRILEEA